MVPPVCGLGAGLVFSLFVQTVLRALNASKVILAIGVGTCCNGTQSSSAERFRQHVRILRVRKRIAGAGTREVRMSCGEFLVGDAFVGCGRDQGVKPNPSAAFHSLMQFLLVNELFYCSL